MLMGLLLVGTATASSGPSNHSMVLGPALGDPAAAGKGTAFTVNVFINNLLTGGNQCTLDRRPLHVAGPAPQEPSSWMALCSSTFTHTALIHRWREQRAARRSNA